MNQSSSIARNPQTTNSRSVGNDCHVTEMVGQQKPTPSFGQRFQVVRHGPQTSTPLSSNSTLPPPSPSYVIAESFFPVHHRTQPQYNQTYIAQTPQQPFFQQAGSMGLGENGLWNGNQMFLDQTRPSLHPQTSGHRPQVNPRVCSQQGLVTASQQASQQRPSSSTGVPPQNFLFVSPRLQPTFSTTPTFSPTPKDGSSIQHQLLDHDIPAPFQCHNPSLPLSNYSGHATNVNVPPVPEANLEQAPYVALPLPPMPREPKRYQSSNDSQSRQFQFSDIATKIRHGCEALERLLRDYSLSCHGALKSSLSMADLELQRLLNEQQRARTYIDPDVDLRVRNIRSAVQDALNGNGGSHKLHETVVPQSRAYRSAKAWEDRDVVFFGTEQTEQMPVEDQRETKLADNNCIASPTTTGNSIIDNNSDPDQCRQDFAQSLKPNDESKNESVFEGGSSLRSGLGKEGSFPLKNGAPKPSLEKARLSALLQLRKALKAKKRALQGRARAGKETMSERSQVTESASEKNETAAIPPIHALTDAGLQGLFISNISDSGPENKVRFVADELSLKYEIEDSSSVQAECAGARKITALPMKAGAIESKTDGGKAISGMPSSTSKKWPEPKQSTSSISKPCMNFLKRKLELTTKILEAKEKRQRLLQQKATIAQLPDKKNNPTEEESKENHEKYEGETGEENQVREYIGKDTNKQELPRTYVEAVDDETILGNIGTGKESIAQCGHANGTNTREDLLRRKEDAERNRAMKYFKHLIVKQEDLLASQNDELGKTSRALSDCNEAIALTKKEILSRKKERRSLLIQKEAMDDLVRETGTKILSLRSRLY